MYTYNPNDTTVTVDGVFVTGVGEDMITFEFQEERFEPAVGAQGDVVVNETNNKLADMTITKNNREVSDYRCCVVCCGIHFGFTC